MHEYSSLNIIWFVENIFSLWHTQSPAVLFYLPTSSHTGLLVQWTNKPLLRPVINDCLLWVVWLLIWRTDSFRISILWKPQWHYQISCSIIATLYQSQCISSDFNTYCIVRLTDDSCNMKNITLAKFIPCAINHFQHLRAKICLIK